MPHSLEAQLNPPPQCSLSPGQGDGGVQGSRGKHEGGTSILSFELLTQVLELMPQGTKSRPNEVGVPNKILVIIK